MIKRPIDGYVPTSVLTETKKIIEKFKSQNGKIKVIQIGYEDFHRVVDVMMENQYVPFTPTMLGYPVDIGLYNSVNVVAVREKSPLLSINISGKQIEII